MNINTRIRVLRKALGMNQYDLAEAVGVSVDTVRRWESDKRVPRADELMNLASVLRVTMNELLNGPEKSVWELRLVMRKADNPQKGVIDMTQGSSAALYVEDDQMAVTLSGSYELWEDDEKFEELIEQLRSKRKAGLKLRREDW